MERLIRRFTPRNDCEKKLTLRTRRIGGSKVNVTLNLFQGIFLVYNYKVRCRNNAELNSAHDSA